MEHNAFLKVCCFFWVVGLESMTRLQKNIKGWNRGGGDKTWLESEKFFALAASAASINDRRKYC